MANENATPAGITWSKRTCITISYLFNGSEQRVAALLISGFSVAVPFLSHVLLQTLIRDF